MRAIVADIRIHPIKGLDPVSVGEARVLASGALAGDRRLAMLDVDGGFVNGKHEPAIHRIRARYDLGKDTVLLSQMDSSKEQPFALNDDLVDLTSWLCEALHRPVRVTRDDESGFPDDAHALGPTFISTASIEAVGGWFPGMTLDSVRRRFRANIEIGGTPAFWEDRLYGPGDGVVRFRAGATVFEGTNPCQRCVVPSRDPDTGEPRAGFLKLFSDYRRETLPAWADRGRFDHFFRFAINSRLAHGSADAGADDRIIRVGDSVDLVTRA